MLFQNRALFFKKYPDLETLGVDEDLLISVARASFNGMQNTNAADHTGRAGSDARAEAIRVLRTSLLEQGWRIKNVKNFAWAYSPCGAYRIGVSSATCLGSPGTSPKTKNRKGPIFNKAAETNVQLSLFSENEDGDPVDGSEDNAETWIVLFQHVEEPEEQTLVELARPELRTVTRTNGKSKEVISWEDRWILNPVKHNELGIGDADDHEDDHEDEVDFQIANR